MKPRNLKSIILTSLHILFWFISFNFWSIILNPGIDSSSVIASLEVGLGIIVLLNFIFLFYGSLPFIWLIKKLRLWIKMVVSILFLVPIGLLIGQDFFTLDDKYFALFSIHYYLKNFLYVLVFHLSIAAAVYVNLGIVAKRFIKQGRFVVYTIYALALCAIAAVMNYSVFDFVIDKIFPSLYYISYFKVWELFFIVAAYLLFTTAMFLVGQYAAMLIANRDAARNELLALKGQINPHFLFNNLNTIYSMAAQKDERTASTVLKLSDFLRYVLYDTSNETIPLKKEVEIIRTYVSLQQERVNNDITKIELTTEGNFGKATISPLLLLPLAENCFKHGIAKTESIIQIHIRYNDKHLILNTKNTIAPKSTSEITETGGIGIKNVEKRLLLTYPNRHTLKYHEEEGMFYLEMKIEL